MKMFFKIVKYRFISGIKHPVVLVCLFLALICSILVGVYAEKTYNESSLYPIAVVDEDGGEFSQKFIKNLKSNEQIEVKLLSREKAIRQVSTGRVDGAFILLDNFSDKIDEGDFEEIIEFIAPTVTTSAYPVSEIVSSEVTVLWLSQIVENSLFDLHEDLGDGATAEFSDILSKLENKEYDTDDIISIKYVGDEQIDYTQKGLSPVDRAVGIYASFIIFAVLLSGEWIFNIKRRGLQSRFISANTSIEMVCLGSQIASVLSAIMFFIPLLVFMQVYLSLSFLTMLYIFSAMLLFLLCICSMAFAISIFSDNLIQLVVIGASAAIINILLSSLAMPLPNWAGSADLAAKILPGTYLLECYKNTGQLLTLSGVTLFWIVIGYLSIIRLKNKAQ